MVLSLILLPLWSHTRHTNLFYCHWFSILFSASNWSKGYFVFTGIDISSLHEQNGGFLKVDGIIKRKILHVRFVSSRKRQGTVLHHWRLFKTWHPWKKFLLDQTINHININIFLFVWVLLLKTPQRNPWGWRAVLWWPQPVGL